MEDLISKKGDISTGNALPGSAQVQIARYQGMRGTQEDRYYVAAGIAVKPEEAVPFLEQMIAEASAKTQAHNVVGTTATLALITEDHVLNIAHVGDSPVTLYLFDPATGGVEARKLTRDHHLESPGERRRTLAEGGKIVHERGHDWLFGIGTRGLGLLKKAYLLAMTRSLGDNAYKGVSHKPEITTVDLKPYLEKGLVPYVAVDSDGIGCRPGGNGGQRDVTKEQAEYIRDVLAGDKDANLAEALADHALLEGSNDNCTSVVVKVPAVMTGPLLLGVADGHGGDKAAEQTVQSFKKSVMARMRALIQPILQPAARNKTTPGI